MSIYKDGKLIAGGRQCMPLLSFMWADHQLNDASWLRADTFSWQSGSVYQAVYQHLADDITGKTLQSETISGTTIQFYLGDDGHKICPASQESNVTAIYNATGVAWYYIIDTTNQRFKLPRTKFGFTGLRDTVGKYVAAGLPDHNHAVSIPSNYGWAGNTYLGGSDQNYVQKTYSFTSDNASASNSVYGNSDTVQPKATEMYLYFYVGNFTQTALENTAGVTTEILNDKADLDFSNTTMIDYVVEKQDPTSSNNYTWYRKYKSGWVEQGGYVGSNTSTVTLLVPMNSSDYTLVGISNSDQNRILNLRNKNATSFLSANYNSGSASGFSWQASGMAA